MRYLVAVLASLGLAAAAEEDAVPGVDAVIASRVASLPEPTPVPIPKGMTMAITSSDPKAQKHVLDGISNLHGGWDFEAYRHFCAALKLDPDCLMAHWGVVVALIDPEPDLVDERSAALRRMVELVEKQTGTELERSYAFAIATFFQKGAAATAGVFQAVSEKFPNDPQLKMLAAAFGRTGYDEEGKPNPEQERAEALLDQMLTQDPDHPLYLYAYLTIRAEAPDLRGDLARARRLCQIAPGYAPALHMLGHYELRNGNVAQAIDAFSQSGEAYRQWMKATGVTHADCPGWVKAECYRAAALATKGDYANALAVGKSVAAIELPPERARSEGGQLLLWEGRTLETRLLMRRGAAGDTAAALAALPAPEKQKVYGKTTHSVWFYQGLAFILEARKALQAGNLEECRKIADAVTLHGEKMAENRDAAAAAGERSAWIRAFNALEVYAGELRGAMAMAGPKEDIGSAFNWYRAALDRQGPPTMLMPPTVLLPMQARLAEYYVAKGTPDAAVDILIQAQGRHTNDVEILTRLQTALTKVGEEIEKVRSE
jgi:tetratricopeptide (TPR) repeat protein